MEQRCSYLTIRNHQGVDVLGVCGENGDTYEAHEPKPLNTMTTIVDTDVIKTTRIYIRRYKRNPDFWEVCGTGKNVQVRTKREAQSIASARRRVREKRAARNK